MTKDLLIVFLKNPQYGKVKTRLAKTIGHEKALAIYYKLISDTCETVSKVDADKAIFYSDFLDTEDIWQSTGYRKAVQQGHNIGERMFNSLKMGKEWGYDKVGLIGADIYDLSAEILNEAFHLMDLNDYIFGPARDGGYYFVGCKNPIPGVFQLKKWSHENVLGQSLAKVRKLNFTCHLINELNDVDTIEDLKGTPYEKYLFDQA